MKPEEFWEPDAALKDFLLETNMSWQEIAYELGWSVQKTTQRAKQLGLSWVKRNNRKLSRGHASLLAIMQKLLPGEQIVTEHPVGDQLRLDIYCPSYKLGAEYHGRQHFFYSNLYYDDERAFKDAQHRDLRKVEICKEQGIALVTFRFCDKLTEDAVFDRMMDAIRSTPYVKEEKISNFKGNYYYEKMKQRNREYRKQQYRQFKKRNG